MAVGRPARGSVPVCRRLLVVCPTRTGRKETAAGATILADLGLQLSPEKTRIVDLTRGWQRASTSWASTFARSSPGSGGGRWYLQRWPSARAMSGRPGPRSVGWAPTGGSQVRTWRPVVVVPPFNPVLRGWGNYFRHGELGAEVLPDRLLRPRAPCHPGQHQARALGPGTGPVDYNGAWFRRLGAHTLTRDGAPTGLRMPRDERCRRAVCGRTACTVRCGGEAPGGQSASRAAR